MAKQNEQTKTEQQAKPPAPPDPPTTVEVICEGFLGGRLLQKGEITSDPEYVALIGDPRNLVKEVE